MSCPPIVTYSGNGSNTDFAVPFPYIDRSHVLSTGGTFSFITNNFVRFDTAPSGTFEIYRRSSPETRLVTYLSAKNRDEATWGGDSRQLFYLFEEVECRTLTTAVSDAPRDGNVYVQPPPSEGGGGEEGDTWRPYFPPTVPGSVGTLAGEDVQVLNELTFVPFGGGDDMPQGRYLLSYVSGAMKDEASNPGFHVQGFDNAPIYQIGTQVQYNSLVGTTIAIAPGIASNIFSSGWPTVAGAESANNGQSVVLDHYSDGPIAIRLFDLDYSNNLGTLPTYNLKWVGFL